MDAQFFLGDLQLFEGDVQLLQGLGQQPVVGRVGRATAQLADPLEGGADLLAELAEGHGPLPRPRRPTPRPGRPPVIDGGLNAASERPAGLRVVHVNSAQEMLTALTEHYSSHDALIMAAAVADFNVGPPADHKIKRGEHELELRLLPNPDLLAATALLWTEKHPVRVGFAPKAAELLRGSEVTQCAICRPSRHAEKTRSVAEH